MRILSIDVLLLVRKFIWYYGKLHYNHTKSKLNTETDVLCFVAFRHSCLIKESNLHLILLKPFLILVFILFITSVVLIPLPLPLPSFISILFIFLSLYHSHTSFSPSEYPTISFYFSFSLFTKNYNSFIQHKTWISNICHPTAFS